MLRLSTSRGCKYRCIFCSFKYHKIPIFWSAERIVQELRRIRKMIGDGVLPEEAKRIHFLDDDFFGDADRAKDFLEMVAADDSLRKYFFFDFNASVGSLFKYAREPKLLPRNILSQVEARKILEKPDIHRPLGYRDRVILELFYSTGIRMNELRFIDLNDINCHDRVLLIRKGKGNKDRYVPIGRSAHQFIEGYIQHIRRGLLRNKINDALFVTEEGNRLGKTALDKLIRKYARLANIKKVVSRHTWRHTCATHLVNNGMDIRHVQALLGHASLDSTQIYTRVAIKDLKRVIRKHHPREKAGRGFDFMMGAWNNNCGRE